jgi:HlyD family secretion protein
VPSELHGLRIDRSLKSAHAPRGGGWVWVVLLLLLAAGGGWFYLHIQAAVPVKVVRVALVQAAPLDDVVLNATGYVVAAHKIELAPKVNGRTAWVGVDMGDKVTKGEPLVKLEQEEFLAQCKQQQGQLDNAKALLEQYLNGSLPEEIAEAKSQLENTRANLIDAQANLARIADAVKTKAVSQQSLDDAQAAYDRAKAMVDNQQAIYGLSVKGPRKELIDAQRAAVEQAQGILDLMNVNLANTVIRSPIDGTVLDRNVEVGEYVTTGFVGDNGAKGYVVSLADLNDLRVELDISQNDFNKISADSKCTIFTDAYPDRKYEGKVDQISPEANRQKATILVKVKILHPDELLRPDMNATVSFLREVSATQPAVAQMAAVFIPSSSVRDGNVLVVEEGKAAQRAVQLGPANGANVRINSGLSAGDLVILDPPAGLQAGRAVSAEETNQESSQE